MNPIKVLARNLRSFLTQDFLGHWQAQDKRADAYEASVDTRLEVHQAAVDARVEAHQAAVDARIEERLAAITENLDQHLKSLDQRFDQRALALDLRVDDRLVQVERNTDQRFEVLEQRTDARMEVHERKVDGKIHQTSQDIVDRNDLMLQIFEQRLDELRHQVRALREARRAATPVDERAEQQSEAAPGSPPANAREGGEDSTLASAISSANGAGAKPAFDHHEQLQSFRKLAESAAHGRAKLASGSVPLYHQILDWKKTAHEGLNHFTPDEQETVDYILSFISDPKEIEYAKQHLRRFVATLQRIPPARQTSDRLLELGSLLHLSAAIKKYCGYAEVCCADFWPVAAAEEKVSQETLRQKNGPESQSFELRNFNVERDPFPYPDGHFRAVLCCELIEHLQSDPLHMLWECNRVLEMDGYLLLTTPNIASCRAIEGLLVGCAPYLLSQYNLREAADQHHREYAPYEVGIALSAAGFTVVELEAEDVWLRSNPAIMELLKQLQLSTEMRGDNIFALARKTGAPVERYPKELYID